MGIFDQAASLLHKATDFKNRVFGFETIDAPEETTYKDRLFKSASGNGSGKPALQHKFVLQIQESGNNSESKMHFLDSVMFMPDVDTSFMFNIDPKTGYSILTTLPNLEKLTITYWDFDDYPHTKFLTEKYYSQFAEDGLLKLPYATTKVIITDELQGITLDNCAISKPKSNGFNASLGARVFSFDITYHDISSTPSSIDGFHKLMMSMTQPQ